MFVVGDTLLLDDGRELEVVGHSSVMRKDGTEEITVKLTPVNQKEHIPDELMLDYVPPDERNEEYYEPLIRIPNGLPKPSLEGFTTSLPGVWP